MNETEKNTPEHIRQIIEQQRADLHTEVDRQMNRLLEKAAANEQLELLIWYPITAPTLKGKKPLLLRLPDGREIAVSTWKQVAAEILRECSSTPKCHAALTEMCGKVFGRQRLLLSPTPEPLNQPLKIDEDLYFEGKFDTESLLNVLCHRILDAVGYDYSSIWVNIYFGGKR